MKTGVIVYIAGGDRMVDDFDIERAVQRLDLEADGVEVVSPSVGHFDVMDAWWRLIVRGMKSIVCLMTEVTDNSDLRLTGRELRLCG